MIEIKITEQMKQRAWRKARSMGKLKNSITSGEGNIAGFLGEEVANEIINGIVSNTYDYDILYETASSKIKYDVKTKRCTSEPKPFYECSVAAYNTKQECDRYAFVRVEYKNGKWGRAWLLGWLAKEDYFRNAHELRKGQVDPSNGFRVKANCYNVAISDLKKFRKKKGKINAN